MATDQSDLATKSIHCPPSNEVAGYLNCTGNGEIDENISTDLPNVLGHSKQSHAADNPVEKDGQRFYPHVGRTE